MLAGYHIDKLIVFVSDYQQSIKFYRDQLGLPILWENPDRGNAGFRAGHNIIIMNVSPDRIGKGSFQPYFTVNNIELLHQKAKEARIDCSDIQDFGIFYWAALKDPDKHAIILMEPKPDYVPRLEQYLGHPLAFPSPSV